MLDHDTIPTNLSIDMAVLLNPEAIAPQLHALPGLYPPYSSNNIPARGIADVSVNVPPEMRDPPVHIPSRLGVCVLTDP